MFSNLTILERPSKETHSMRQTAYATARAGNRLDTEMATQLRIYLRADFENAESWSALRRALRNKGFSLKVEQGRLRLVDSLSRVDICSTGFLGFPLAQLEREFGASLESNLWNNWVIG